MQFFQALKYAAAVFAALWCSVFVVQYACLRLQTETRPSDLLWWMADWLEFLWEQAGRWVAWLSGFLDWLEWKDILRTFNDIQRPITEMVLSPLQFVCGYVMESRLYNHPAVVHLGSLLLMASISVLLWRYTRFGSSVKRYWAKCTEWQLPPAAEFGPDPHTAKKDQ